MNLKSQAFAILFVVSLIAAGGNMALQSVLPTIGREFGLADTLVAGAFALSALLWTVASPIWARRSDVWGRKRTIQLGMAGFAVSMAGFGLATTAGLEGWLGAGVAFALMAAARAVYGLFGSAAPIASQAYVADRTTPQERTRAMSMLASAQGLGTVVGPTLAPFLVLPIVGLAGPMYVFALIGAGALVWVTASLPSGEVPRQSRELPPTKGLWRDPRISGHLTFGLLVTGVQAVNISVLGFHVIDELAKQGMSAVQAQPFIGLAMFAGAAATLLAQWGLIPLLNLQPRALMRWGAGLALLGNLLSVVAPDFFAVVVGYALVSLGLGFARPGFTAGSSLAVGPNEQGAIAGLIMALAGISFLIPPVLGVALYEWREPAPFWLNCAMAALALILAFTLKGLRGPPTDVADVEEAAGTHVQPASQPGPEGAR